MWWKTNSTVYLLWGVMLLKSRNPPYLMGSVKISFSMSTSKENKELRYLYIFNVYSVFNIIICFAILFFHTQCFLHFLFLQHNIPSRTSAALVGSNLTLPMSISRNLHAILLFQLHELDKRRMNFWVTIWKITIACLGFSPRFHSAYCKWISTRASIMDRNLFFVFTNYIVLKLLNACISIVHVPAYSRFPPWRPEMVSKLSLSYGRKIHCWNTHYLKQVNVLNIFGLKHERFTLIFI